MAAVILLRCQMPELFAASGKETREFNAAKQNLQLQLFPLAEKGFSEFLEKHPASDLRDQALLNQAKARTAQTNYTGAIELLANNLATASTNIDQFYFGIGDNLFRQAKFREAARSFHNLFEKNPTSTLRLEASFSEAISISKLKDWPTVIGLLGNTNGVFSKAAQEQPSHESAVQGKLLLVEAFIAQKQFAQAEDVLKKLDAVPLSPESKWKQQFFLGRSLLETGKLNEALAGTTNLINSAGVTGKRRLVGESVTFQGEVLERLGRLPEAVQSYGKNLSNGLPPEIIRQSLFKIVALLVAQNKSEDATNRLSKFIEQSPQDPAMDVALLSLGELQLKAAIGTNGTVIPANTYLLQAACTNFMQVTEKFPQSAFAGQAWLDRGWCLWVDGKMEESGNSFSNAVIKLQGTQQAVAQFKLADTQFRLKDFASAAKNYAAVSSNFAGVEAVQKDLLEQALYQLVRASLADGKPAQAQEALSRLLKLFPNGSVGGRSLLLVGQELDRVNNSKEARELFAEFLKQFPNTELLPEIKLALARTYVHEKNWPEALTELNGWINQFTNHTRLPEAEYDLALTYARAGMETNALNQFTNFVVKYSASEFAPLAQNWVADFYFNHDAFVEADKQYQYLYQNTNAPAALARQARLMAGRAAFARQEFRAAREQFSAIINDTNTAPGFLSEAYYALGDTIFEQYLTEPNSTNDYFRESIAAFDTITEKFPTNRVAILAWGRKGDCYLQSGILKTNAAAFAQAIHAYETVVNSPLADAATRSQAEVGVGLSLERQGKTDEAFERYMNVVTRKNLRDGEKFDPIWIKESGLYAANILEVRQEGERAANVYRKIAELVPSLGSMLEKRIDSATPKQPAP